MVTRLSGGSAEHRIGISAWYSQIFWAYLGLVRLVDAYAAVQVAWTAQGCCNLCTVLLLYQITFFGVTLEHVYQK